MKKLVLISACLLIFASCGQQPEPQETSLGELHFANGVVTWDSLVGSGIEVKGLQDEDFRDVEGNNFQVTKNDILTFRAKVGNGYKEGKNRTKYIVTSLPATADKVLEDGSEPDNETLAENYDITRYWQNDWQDASSFSKIVLDESNGNLSAGKCVRLDYYCHETWFKYAQEINLSGSYDTFSFFARAEAETKYSLTFQIMKNVLIAPGFDLVGVYMSYKDENPSQFWQQRTITMSDNNWNINYGGTDYKFYGDKGLKKTLADGGFYINSLGDLFPFFSQFQFRAYGPRDTVNYRAIASWYDEVKLSNTGRTESETKTLKSEFAIKDNYIMKSDSFNGKVKKVDENNLTLTVDTGNQTVNLPVAVTHNQDNTKRMVCTTQGFDFDMVVFSRDGGQNLEIESVTGSAADKFENFKCEAFTILDDFESYSETGVGYDQKNAADTRSGMRANYYADYWDDQNYTAEKGSPVGGTNWLLMGSTDYSTLETTEKHTGSKSVKLKSSATNALRYLTYGLYDDTAKNHPFKGSTFSFFAKGADVNLKLNVRVFYISKLDPTNHILDNEYLQVEIPANSGWAEYTVPLKASKTYYGFSMATVAHWSSENKYFYVDDITVYGSMSPWSAQ